MTDSRRPLARFRAEGSIKLMVAGVAFLAAAQLMYCFMPEWTSRDIGSWSGHARSWLQMANECRMIGALALVSGVLATPRSARPATLHAITRGAFLLAGVLSAGTVLFEGRLAYPIAHLGPDSSAAGFALSLTLGGMHAVAVLFGFGVAAQAMAAVRVGRPGWCVAGAVVAFMQVLGSFPWVYPRWVEAVSVLCLWVWFIAYRPRDSQSLRN